MPDPGNSFDAMAENFSNQMRAIAADAKRITIFRELSKDQQLRCLIEGVIDGLAKGCVELALSEVPQGMAAGYVTAAFRDAMSGLARRVGVPPS